MRFLLWVFIVNFCTTTALAAVQFPNGLNKTERKEVVRILGFGTTSKLLTDPYPLGGYAGFEIGAAVETVPVSEISRMGSDVRTGKPVDSPQQDITYAKFTVGKGLYNNLDLFFHFVPYSQRNEISQYGGLIRWGFYQAPYLPFSLSLLGSFTSTVFSSRVQTYSTAADIIGGVNVDDISVFAGGGIIHADGYFVGGKQGTDSTGSPVGVTDSLNTEYDFADGSHIVIGGNLKIDQFMLTLQMDRYTQTVFSAKTSWRF